MAQVYTPIWPACWVQCADHSRSSPSVEVQNSWDAYCQELSCVPIRVREKRRQECDGSDVYAAWQIWSREAEAGLVRAFDAAGGPALAGRIVREG